MPPTSNRRPLTPEEESVGDPDDDDETETDDTLPADLWFCGAPRPRRTAPPRGPGAVP